MRQKNSLRKTIVIIILFAKYEYFQNFCCVTKKKLNCAACIIKNLADKTNLFVCEYFKTSR